MTERTRRFRQLPLVFSPEDDAGQVLPRRWRGWPTKVTETPKEPPPSGARHGKRRAAKPHRKITPALIVMAVTTAIMGGTRHGSAQRVASSADSATSFSGEYYDGQDKFGFNLDAARGTATATVSNSPNYKVGQVMLRITMTGPREFVGEQLFTDGKFHQIAGSFIDNGTIHMMSRESGTTAPFQWITFPVRALKSLLADARICSLNSDVRSDAEGDRIIATCTRLIDAVKAKFGNVPADFAESFYVRGNLRFTWTTHRDLASALADLTEAIRLRPDFALAVEMRGLVYTAAGQPQAAVNDFDRAIYLGERLPGTDATRDMIQSSALYGRAVAFAKMGDREKAIRDYENCKDRFPEWVKAFDSSMDPALSAALLNVGPPADGNQRTSPAADQTFICNNGDSRDLTIVTVSPRLRMMRFEVNTSAINSRCTLEFRDGRFGNTVVSSIGPGLGCAGLAELNGDMQQKVTITRAEPPASAIRNGIVGLKINLNLETGILRSTAGTVTACHRAHG